jgi:hypothetical protein
VINFELKMQKKIFEVGNFCNKTFIEKTENLNFKKRERKF